MLEFVGMVDLIMKFQFFGFILRYFGGEKK